MHTHTRMQTTTQQCDIDGKCGGGGDGNDGDDDDDDNDVDDHDDAWMPVAYLQAAAR